MNLLQMPSGDLLDPILIRAVLKFANKGVIIRNEYNKPICFEPVKDPVLQNVIVEEIGTVLKAGKNWVQPGWDAAFAKAQKPEAADTTDVK